MNRHQFMLDLLRPDITVEDLIEGICSKQELTTKDLNKIIKHADMVKEAASIRKRQLLKK